MDRHRDRHTDIIIAIVCNNNNKHEVWLAETLWLEFRVSSQAYKSFLCTRYCQHTVTSPDMTHCQCSIADYSQHNRQTHDDWKTTATPRNIDVTTKKSAQSVNHASSSNMRYPHITLMHVNRCKKVPKSKKTQKIKHENQRMWENLMNSRRKIFA